MHVREQCEESATGSRGGNGRRRAWERELEEVAMGGSTVGRLSDGEVRAASVGEIDR